ncbi:MAG: hypothetical protein ACREOH_05395, partial [Candidatus Entotheonellia bacterium]
YRAHIVEFAGESFRFRQRLQRDAQKHKGSWAMDSDGMWKTPRLFCEDPTGVVRFPHPLENATRFPHCPQPRRQWFLEGRCKVYPIVKTIFGAK